LNSVQELLTETLDWSYPCFYELHYLTPSKQVEHRIVYQADSLFDIRDKVSIYLGAFSREPHPCEILSLSWKRNGTFQEWFGLERRSETKITKPVDKTEMLRRLLESEDL